MRKTRENLTERERLLAELCVHEAGHAVAGVLLGGVLRSASVSGGLRAGAIGGRTTFEMLPPACEPQTAYAGVWAQARWRCVDRRPSQGDVYAVLRGAGSEDDRVILASGVAAAVAGRVVPLMERCWPAVRALAGKICADTVARHADVREALGLSAEPATAAHELALIRGGYAPGSFRVTRQTVSA